MGDIKLELYCEVGSCSAAPVVVALDGRWWADVMPVVGGIECRALSLAPDGAPLLPSLLRLPPGRPPHL